MAVEAGGEFAGEVGVAGRVVSGGRGMCGEGGLRVAVFGEELVAFPAGHAYGKGRGMKDGTRVAARETTGGFFMELEGFWVAFDKAGLCGFESNGGVGDRCRLGGCHFGE